MSRATSTRTNASSRSNRSLRANGGGARPIRACNGPRPVAPCATDGAITTKSSAAAIDRSPFPAEAVGGDTPAARYHAYPPTGAKPWPTLTNSATARSEEHTSELQSLMRISYAVFCLKKKTRKHTPPLNGHPATDKKTHTD